MKSEQKLPNFIVAGAAKSGSTSLYEYIKGHPQIFLPEKKESRYFASEVLKNTLGYNKTSIFTWQDFAEQYQAVTNEQLAIGDFGNLYMIFPELAITNIKEKLGNNVKLVLIIRNPIKRAYSAYQMARRNFYEDQSFEKGIELETERLNEGYVPCDIIAYKKMGMYANPISEFKKHFNTYVIVLEELKKHPQNELKKLFEFLEVSTNYRIQADGAYNKGGSMPTGNVNVFRIQRFLKSLKPILGFIPGLSRLSEWLVNSISKNLSNKTNKQAQPLSIEQEQQLFKLFEKDILETSQLLDKDLMTLWDLKKYQH